jgi:hypothetical protein
MVALVLCAAYLFAAEPAGNLFRVRRVVDVSGKVRELGTNTLTKTTVLVFLGTECPISQRVIPELNRIAASHKTNAVEFYGVVSSGTMTREKAAAFAGEYAITFPLLVDRELALARWLRPTHVPEAYVLKVDGDVVYHGRINDSYEAVGKPRTVIQHHDLRDAISAVLAGRAPDRFFSRPVGCYFEELSR